MTASPPLKRSCTDAMQRFRSLTDDYEQRKNSLEKRVFLLMENAFLSSRYYLLNPPLRDMVVLPPLQSQTDANVLTDTLFVWEKIITDLRKKSSSNDSSLLNDSLFACQILLHTIDSYVQKRQPINSIFAYIDADNQIQGLMELDCSNPEKCIEISLLMIHPQHLPITNNPSAKRGIGTACILFAEQLTAYYRSPALQLEPLFSAMPFYGGQGFYLSSESGSYRMSKPIPKGSFPDLA